MTLRAALLAVALCVLLAPGLPGRQAGKGAAPPVEPIDAARLKRLLAQDSGKVILVNAWASWCKPCKEEIPGLLRLRRTYFGKGLRVIFISADDPELLESAVRPTLDTLGVDFVTYISRDSSETAFIEGLNPAWGGALPASFLYDRSGKQARFFVGEKSYAQFEQAVLPLLGAMR